MIDASKPTYRALVGFYQNHLGIELSLIPKDGEGEEVATEYLSPARAIEIAGKLLAAAHRVLLAGDPATRVNYRPEWDAFGDFATRRVAHDMIPSGRVSAND